MKTQTVCANLSSRAALLMVLSVVSAQALSACGGVSYREVPGSGTSPSSSSNSGSSDQTYTDDEGNTYHDTSSDDYSSESSASETYQITSTFKLAGPDASSGSTYTRTGISTDNLLKITVTGGQPTQIASGGNYVAGYTCIRVSVTVNGDTQDAFVTNTGHDGWGYCYGAKSSVTLDFSGSLSPGHGTVSVRVSDAQYDNCRLYGNFMSGGCPISSVYTVNGSPSHYIQGRMQIQVNSPAL